MLAQACGNTPATQLMPPTSCLQDHAARQQTYLLDFNGVLLQVLKHLTPSAIRLHCVCSASNVSS